MSGRIGQRAGAPGSRIISVGSFRPARVVTNAEICERIDSTDEWIRERSGIIERRFAAPDESVADMAAVAGRLAVERAKNGQAVDANIVGLSSEFTRIERNRAAALKAEEDRQAALKQTNNEIGRTITLLEARAIAEKAGGRVTSDQRSYAQQQALYDKYMAYKNGTGPWAALAAKPGTSNHELGQALDVAKSDGMTLAKLVKAYRAAGVKLTEALDEGSHFHIAWAAGKAVTEAAKEADKVAKWLEEQRLKAQGNVWQLAQDIDKRNADFGKDAPTLGVDESGPRADESRDGRSIVAFAHVDTDHGPLVVEHELGERLRELRLADTGRAEEHERPDRAVRVGEPGTTAADRVRHRAHTSERPRPRL